MINDTHYVSPELRQRVLDAIEELNYRPNRLAQALSRKSVPMLALIVPDISNPYWSSVARAVQDALEGIVYVNDSQVTDLRSRKMYGSRPGVLISWRARAFGE